MVRLWWAGTRGAAVQIFKHMFLLVKILLAWLVLRIY